MLKLKPLSMQEIQDRIRKRYPDLVERYRAELCSSCAEWGRGGVRRQAITGDHERGEVPVF